MLQLVLLPLRVMFASMHFTLASHGGACFMVALRHHATLPVAALTKRVQYPYRLKLIRVRYETRKTNNKPVDMHFASVCANC
jgi:hypothetical protein